MFAFSAAAQGGIALHELDAMATALRGGTRRPAVWCDQQGRAGVAVGVTGILPEDVFDRQPLVSPELVFAAQARIDNRNEVLGKLAVPREQWANLADSDVLYRAYRRWGEDCVQHLTGDYAFAAWHRDNGRLVAAVDHIGSTRLYYAEDRGKLILSAQLGALLAHPQAPHGLDLKALGLLAAPKIDMGSTPYKHIRALIGGHMLTYERETLEIRRWWQPDTTVRARYRDPRDYVAHACEIFDRAVRASLRTSGGVSALMSGGLDSTLVAATAAQQLKQRGRTITAYLSVPEPGLACDLRPGWEVDDSPYASAVAQMHDNLNLVKITPGGHCILGILPQIHAVSRTPIRNGANQVWAANAYSAAWTAGARVVLHGGKGNATISQSGEGRLRDLVWRLRWGTAIHQARLCARSGGSAAWRAMAGELIGDKGREMLRRLRGIPSQPRRPGAVLFTAEFRAAQAQGLASFARPISMRAGQVDFMTLPWNQWSADPMAQWGVEPREPTADRYLIECLLSFPLEAFSIAGLPRGLARAMGHGRVPDSVRLRWTRGAQVPELASLIALHSEKYRDALERAEGSAQFRSIFEIERVRAMLESVCNRRAGRFDAYTLDRVADVGLFIAGAGS
jgi:asparagine synthase (glutamine-hydrolysing)